MDWYTYGCYAAFEKFAFNAQDAKAVMRAVEPYARPMSESPIIGTSKRLAKSVGPHATSPQSTLVELQKTQQEMQQRMQQPPRPVVSQGRKGPQPYRPRETDMREIQGFIDQARQERAAQGLGRMYLPSPKRDVRNIADAARVSKPGLDKKQRAMTHAIAAGHEYDELLLGRYARSNAENPFRVFSHTNPRVILREHARVATLPDRYDRVRELFQKLRTPEFKPSKKLPEAPLSEGALLEEATRGVGGRPGITYGAPGTRLSRHAQKRVSRRMQELLWNKRQAGEF